MEQRAGKLGPRETFRAGTNHLLQAILTQHTWQAKEGICASRDHSVPLNLPNHHPPEQSYSILLLFPKFLQALIQEEAGRCRAGAMGFVCSSFQVSQGAFPSPTGPASQRVPYAFELHYISSAFLPGNGPCSGLGASGWAAPLLSFLHSEELLAFSSSPPAPFLLRAVLMRARTLQKLLC